MYLRCTGKAIFKEICITKHAWELRTPFRSPPAAKEKLLFFSSFPLFRVNNFMREGKKRLLHHICLCQKKGTAWCKYFVLFLPLANLSFPVKDMNKQEENSGAEIMCLLASSKEINMEK